MVLLPMWIFSRKTRLTSKDAGRFLYLMAVNNLVKFDIVKK